MIKTTCTCDRCGKEFPTKESKAIIIKNASEARKQEMKTKQDSLLGDFANVLTSIFSVRLIRDYCPECVEEFKEFLNMNGEKKNEDSLNQH